MAKVRYDQRKPKPDIFRIVTTTFVVLLIVGVLGYAAYIYGDVTGLIGSTQPVKVTVEMGSDVEQIATMLEENGIIASSTAFRVYLAFYETETDFQYGKFEVYPGMDYAKIIETLQTPYISADTFVMMFPEGTTALKMAIMFQDQGVCTVDEFLAACDEVYDVSFYDQIQDSDLKFCKLEGYLFPDTYEFYLDGTPHDFIQAMLENFEAQVYTQENIANITASGLSLEQIVNLASIVQKEAIDSESVRNIASVFRNRVAAGSPEPCLQSDTSTAGRGYITGVLEYYYNELKGTDIPAGMATAYDTYVTVGIPVGAICNPGLDAILGTITPNSTPYYFFVTDEAGNIYYAETYAQHQNNINTANNVNGSR